jgi:hypothetical protein
MNKSLAAGLTLLIAVSAAGCAPKAELTAKEAKKLFLAAANASCDKARTEGVVETSGDFTAVMIPKDSAIDGYSAAYLEAPDTYSLIWEADAFASCTTSIYVSLAEEGGVKPTMKVKPIDGGVSVVDEGWDGQDTHFDYKIENGLFVEVLNSGVPGSDVIKIEYGNITEQETAIIQKAIDAFEAESD